MINQILSNFGVNWPKFFAQLSLFLFVYFILNNAFRPIFKIFTEARLKRIEERASMLGKSRNNFYKTGE